MTQLPCRRISCKSRASGSVVEACAAFERFAPLKSISGLRWRRFGWGIGSVSILGWAGGSSQMVSWAGGSSGLSSSGGAPSGLGLEAVHRCPGLDRCAIHRRMRIPLFGTLPGNALPGSGQQRCNLAMRKDRRHHLARNVRGHRTVAVPGENRGHPDIRSENSASRCFLIRLTVDAKPDEPAEQQVILHLLHQLPRRAEGRPPA